MAVTTKAWDASIAPTPPARRGCGARGRRVFVATALWLAVGANAVAITWLWLRDGGITGASSAADRWTSAGRITGLLGGYFALIQVLLLARLPPLEHLVGFDRLTVWHRRNGRVALTLIVAHVVLITVGYELSDQISLGSEIHSLLTQYPGIVTATIATGLLIVVVGTSLVIVRRRLPYELWYAVHLTAYAAIVLAWSHQVPTGNELTADAGARHYWQALYLTALALLVVYRVVRPAIRAIRHRLRVVEVVHEAPDVVSIVVGGNRLDRLRFEPGQFMIWRFLTPGRWWQAHPFSLSRAPDRRTLRITVKGVGGYSCGLTDLRPGTCVLAEGPFGTFTLGARRARRLVLIAGGIGITPIRAMLEALPAGITDARLVHRVMTDDDRVLDAELRLLAAERGVALEILPGDHNDAASGRHLSPGHLAELIPAPRDTDVFICGPPAMTDAVRRAVCAAGVPTHLIHTERFAL